MRMCVSLCVCVPSGDRLSDIRLRSVPDAVTYVQRRNLLQFVDIFCWHTLLTARPVLLTHSVGTFCWHVLLTPFADTPCWHSLLQTILIIMLLTHFADTLCWHTLLTLCVDIFICWLLAHCVDTLNLISDPSLILSVWILLRVIIS